MPLGPGADPVVIDTAATVISYGMVKTYALSGRKMLIDRTAGAPLMDAADSANGMLLPIGGLGIARLGRHVTRSSPHARSRGEVGRDHGWRWRHWWRHLPEVRRDCKANLAAYKAPRRVVFKDALPLGPTGKILKKELRDMIAKEPSGA